MVAAPAALADRPVVDTDTGAADWRALGTHVEVRCAPGVVARAAELVAAVLDEVDAAYSRFRADSDLGAANRAAGSPVPVGALTVGAVRVALEAAHETHGLVDPTLGEVLTASGYDRTFALVPAEDPSPVALPVARGSWRDVVVTDATLTVPRGTALDLGATGKGFAADVAALTVLEELGEPVLVSVGGDLRVATPDDGPAPTPYPVLLGHSRADLAAGGARHLVAVRSGGMATSSTSARRWRRGGRQWHHLLDPRTGLPTTGPWRTVTALGHTAAAANTASTAALVLGEDALRWLLDRGVAARLVDADDHVTTTPAWDASGVDPDEETR